MTKGEIQAIRQVITHLRGTHAQSEHVRESFTNERTRLYLETWVIPSLEWLLPESRDVDAAVKQSR